MNHRQMVLVSQLWWTTHVLTLISMQVVATRYHHIPSVPTYVKWLPVDHTVEQKTFSESVCAHLCRKRACISFTFLDGVCSMDGVGDGKQEMMPTTSFYRRLTNAALNKPAYGSQHYPGARPANTVDDDSTCNVFTPESPDCCYGSYHQPNRWISIDLGSLKRIFAVDIMGEEKNFHPTQVSVGQEVVTDGDLSSYQWFGLYNESTLPWPGRVRFSTPEGITGQVVSLQQFPDKHLRICDIQVLVFN